MTVRSVWLCYLAHDVVRGVSRRLAHAAPVPLHRRRQRVAHMLCCFTPRAARFVPGSAQRTLCPRWSLTGRATCWPQATRAAASSSSKHQRPLELHGRCVCMRGGGAGPAHGCPVARARNCPVAYSARTQSGSGRARARAAPEYKFYAEFQSHEAEFDYLKSLEIEEKINQIKWCSPCHGAHFLLATNGATRRALLHASAAHCFAGHHHSPSDKTVKLWKVHEKQVKTATAMNVGPPGTRGPPRRIDRLRMPKLSVRESVVTAAPRRVFANAHAYHINSISVNSDGESFISADDLRINLWNLSISDSGFNIVDIKPANMEELTEVITSAAFHPSHCHIFAYSTSRGSVKLNDMRASALCDSHTKRACGRAGVLLVRTEAAPLTDGRAHARARARVCSV